MIGRGGVVHAASVSRSNDGNFLGELVGSATGLDMLGVAGKIISELLEGLLGELGLLPQIRGEVAIQDRKGVESGLGEIPQRRRRARRRSEAISNTSILKDLLGGRSSNDTSTAGSRDKTDVNRPALAVDLVGHSVRQTDFLTPIATTHRHHGHLGSQNSSADGVGNLLADFYTKTDVAIKITNKNERLETSALTGASLLLNRLNLHNLILQLIGSRSAEEIVDDLVLLDGHGEQVNVLQRLDLAGFNQTAKLGNWDPLFLITITATTSTATTPATIATTTTAFTITTTTTTTTTTVAETSTKTTPVSHYAA